jgi:hypothetical protein
MTRFRRRADPQEVKKLSNKGMQQSKRGVEVAPVWPSVIDVRFAADAQCSADPLKTSRCSDISN